MTHIFEKIIIFGRWKAKEKCNLEVKVQYLAVRDGIDHEHGDGGEDSADVKDVDDVPLVASLVGVGVDRGRVDSEPPPRPKLQMKGW